MTTWTKDEKTLTARPVKNGVHVNAGGCHSEMSWQSWQDLASWLAASGWAVAS